MTIDFWIGIIILQSKVFPVENLWQGTTQHQKLWGTVARFQSTADFIKRNIEA
jgi:hypothetical protein